MITYNLIMHVNSALAAAGLYYKLRFRDGQTAAIEPLGHCCCEGTEREFSDFVTEAFAKEGIEVSVDMQTLFVCVRE